MVYHDKIEIVTDNLGPKKASVCCNTGWKSDGQTFQPTH
jgi:hypothetical protein